MRLVLAFAVLATSAVSAQAAEDRYGPSRGSAPGAVPAEAYAGATLSWSGKTAPAAAQTSPTAAPARPALIPGGLYRSAATPTPQAPMAAAPVSAPTSLYSRPVAQAPVSQLPPPPSPTVVQGGLYASGGARFYSVHRPYGETPDPIPATPEGERMAYRPEASLAGAVSLSGVGDSVRDLDAPADDSMAGVGGLDAQEEAERAAKRDAERTAARRAAAGGAK